MKERYKRAQTRRRNKFNISMISQIDSYASWRKTCEKLHAYNLDVPVLVALRPLVNALLSWTTPGCRCHKLETIGETERLLLLSNVFNDPKLDVSNCPRCNAIVMIEGSDGVIDPEDLLDFTDVSLVWLRAGLFCYCSGRGDCNMCRATSNLMLKRDAIKASWDQATSKRARMLLGIHKLTTDKI